MEEERITQQLNNAVEKDDTVAHYTKEQRKEFNSVQKQIVYRRRRMGVIFAVALVMIGFLGTTIVNNFRKISRLETEYVATMNEQEELNTKKQQLSQEVELLRDPTYLAKLARQKFLISREGETIYYIPELEKNTPDGK